MIDMETLVRQVMAEQTEDLELGPEAATTALRAAVSRRRGQKRLGLLLGSGGVFVVVGTGIAAATGALPWWTSEQAFNSSPFVTSQDPADLAGSQVRLVVPGPESTTFEVVTNTEMIAGVKNDCTAVTVKDARGRTQHLTTSCGGPRAAVPRGGGIDWQAPSGATYVVVSGPAPTSQTVRVALKDSHGVIRTTERVGGGYYLVYVAAQELSPSDSLVFYNASGHVVAEMALGYLAPLRP